MYHLSEIPDAEKENYRTLNHDIGLVKMDNGQLDLWFDNGDLVSATEFHSLQVGIIIACLTSWNYMNRYGNPTYKVFGNESYSLLKRNKNEDVRFKIKAYFEECLERMRRVYSVEKLEVYEVEDNPYKYLVKFTVRAMANYLVSGEFEISDKFDKSTSYIRYTYNQPYSSIENPLQIHLQLFSEYGHGLSNEIVYIYTKQNDDDDFKFYGIKGHTDYRGILSLQIYPEEIDFDTEIKFVYRGNPSFNGVVSKTLKFSSIPFHFNVDENDMLYVTSSIDNIREYIWLGEIIDSSLLEDPNYTLSDPQEWNKLYIAEVDGRYKAYKNINGSLSELEQYDDVILSSESNEIGELHLFIENGKKDGKYLYEIEKSNNHVYYIGD